MGLSAGHMEVTPGAQMTSGTVPHQVPGLESGHNRPKMVQVAHCCLHPPFHGPLSVLGCRPVLIPGPCPS